MMKNRQWPTAVFAVVTAVLLVLGLSGCAASSPTGTTGGGAGPNTVVEKNFTFVPATLTVKVGDKVVFTNQDTVPHHVVVGTTDLGVQQPGSDVTWTADKDGTFPVKCLIHPTMVGQITVGTGAAGSSAPPTGGSSAPPGGGSSAPASGGAGGSSAPASGYGY